MIVVPQPAKPNPATLALAAALRRFLATQQVPLYLRLAAAAWLAWLDKETVAKRTA